MMARELFPNFGGKVGGGAIVGELLRYGALPCRTENTGGRPATEYWLYRGGRISLVAGLGDG